MKPQHAALQAAEKNPMVQAAKWVICIDVDEYINIHVGNGTLSDLIDAVGDINMISMTWRMFGNSDVCEFKDGFIIEQFEKCAPKMTRKPHQAWGFKTLFRNIGIFKKLGVHRPKGLKPQLSDEIKWVNGSGARLPKAMYRNSWRSTVASVGYELVTLNHYAVRSAESFLVKRDRGRVNHVMRDQGLNYWFRMNFNSDQDRSIQRMVPALKREYERLLADPAIATVHDFSVQKHKDKIVELLDNKEYSDFFADITSDRMRKLSRLQMHFGANVFLAGPQVVPDEVLDRDPGENFFFTVERVEAKH